MKVSRPLEVTLPTGGVLFAESVHGPGFAMEARRDPFHKVVYVLRGRVRWSTEGADGGRELGEGSVVLVGAGVSHGAEDVQASTLLLLCLDEGWLEADRERAALWTTAVAGGSRVFELDRPARSRAEASWRRAMAEQGASRPGAGLIVRSLADQALVLVARRPAAAGAGAMDRVRTVLRELDESYFEEWSLDRAAARAGLSRRRFSALFREATGATMVEHVTGVRLERARRMLLAGEHSIMGVMFACGFNDVSHFYRLYRRRFGVPPGAGRAVRD
jgi:AraC family L-rhamnose operon regulatory protein RhaS